MNKETADLQVTSLLFLCAYIFLEKNHLLLFEMCVRGYNGCVLAEYDGCGAVYCHFMRVTDGLAAARPRFSFQTG